MGSVSYAQGVTFYYGAGLDVTSGISNPAFLPNSEGTVTGITALVGMEAPISGAFYYGAEASITYNVAQEWDYDNGSCGSAGSGPYACDLDGSARIVGIIGYSFSSFDVYSSGGIGYVTGTYDYQSQTGMNYGATASVGARYSLSNGLKVRGELIYDNLLVGGVDTYDTTWEAATLRVSLTKNF